jgi:hypothetical protein
MLMSKNKLFDKFYNYQDKTKNINTYVFNYLNKTNSMFKYHNLPESIPADMLESFLQRNGYVCIAKHENTLYAFVGGLGGELDVYYRPTICTVANPALNLSKDFVIDKDCIIMKNDTNLQGLLPIILRYSSMLVENDISMVLATYNTRIQKIVSASDDGTIASAKEYLSQIVSGKQGIIADNAFLKSLDVKDSSTDNKIIEELIKQNQYLKSSMLNEVGLQANTNLKKERLVSAEIESNSESLYPIVDDMLKCRKNALEKVNEMFGTNIEVEFNSSWDLRPLNGMSVHNTDDEIDMKDLESGNNENDDKKTSAETDGGDSAEENSGTRNTDNDENSLQDNEENGGNGEEESSDDREENSGNNESTDDENKESIKDEENENNEKDENEDEKDDNK